MSNNQDFLIGKQKYADKDFSGAISAFNKAIEKEENPYIYYERGLAYLHLKKFEESIKDFDTACSLQPDHPFRYSSRAYVKDLSGDLVGAIADYEKCLELDPNDAVALNNLGLLEEKRGRKEAAKKLVKRADKLADANKYLKEQKDAIEEDSDNKLQDTPSKVSTKEYLTFFKDVITKKDRFNEFLTFVKKGFKPD